MQMIKQSVGNGFDLCVFFDDVELRPQGVDRGRHRLYVGHGADAGVASPGRCGSAGGDGLFIKKSRLSQMYVYICKTWNNDFPCAVDDPDSVVVNEREERKTTILEVHVADSDMGKVIGKQGRIAKAIRSVVKAAAAKEDKKVIVDIMD